MQAFHTQIGLLSEESQSQRLISARFASLSRQNGVCAVFENTVWVPGGQ
jgi:hypothetical protein